MLCLSPRLTGLDGYLFSESDQIGMVSSPPPGAWVLGEDAEFSVNLLAKLSGRELSTAPPAKFQRSLATVMGDSDQEVPWNLVMPTQAHRDYIQKLLDTAGDIIDHGSTCYYRDTFATSRRCLGQLEGAKVNVIEYIAALKAETSDSQRTAIKSFRPNSAGFSARTVYDQTSSRTGRMTVKSGPQILTLRKDLRRIIGSRYEGGRIVQLDYVSLEPRLALAISGKLTGRDVYETIRWEAMEGFLSRDATKQATLSILYGSGWRSLRDSLGISAKQAKDVRSRISNHFDIRSMSDELVKQQMESGTIQNFYGRVLKEEESSAHLLYNNYIQSSAVDVATMGFTQICDEIIQRSLPIHPLFIIHDAIILDCHPDAFDDLKDILHVGETIRPFDIKFYLEIGDLD